MPKDDDGMQDKLDGRVERVEVLGMINRIYRIEKWIGVHRDFYAQECGFSASPRFHIYASICAGRENRLSLVCSAAQAALDAPKDTRTATEGLRST